MRFIRALSVVVLLFPSVVFAQDDPLGRVRNLLASGCYDEARDDVVNASRRFHEHSDAPGEAAAWLLLGLTDCALGDMASQRIDFEEAEVKFIAVDDPFGAWLSVFALAEL